MDRYTATIRSRMRAVSGAFYILINTFLGFALGPYVIGAMSDSFISSKVGP